MGEMSISGFNKIEIKVSELNVIIRCRGVIRLGPTGEMIGVNEDGTVVSAGDEAILETEGGECVNWKEETVQIFPAGIYKLGPPDGIEKIGEIVADD